MKTAEEVAEEIYWKVSKSTNELDWKQLFAQALTAYAEERVKEAKENMKLSLKTHPKGCQCLSHYLIHRVETAEAIVNHSHAPDPDTMFWNTACCDKELKLRQKWKETL